MAKMTKSAKMARKANALESLHNYIKEGDTLVFVRTGMKDSDTGPYRRKWQIFASGISESSGENKACTFFITKHVADAFGYRYSESSTSGIWTTMGYDEFTSYISYKLFGDHYKLKAVVW